MFEKINPPQSHYDGPATGLTTEKGDSWLSAVTKINAGFKNIVEHLKGGAEGIEDWIAKNFASVTTHDALAERVKALEARIDGLLNMSALDPEGKPATGGTPDPNAPPPPPPNPEMKDDGAPIDPAAKPEGTFTAPGAGSA